MHLTFIVVVILIKEILKIAKFKKVYLSFCAYFVSDKYLFTVIFFFLLEYLIVLVNAMLEEYYVHDSN